MQLVIAEKPSVARDLARVLGVRPQGKTCFEGEGDRWVITWCIGHLVELEEPSAYDPAWKAWRLETLPMLPAELRLRPAKHARDQLRAVTQLLRDRRFASVVNACDAGREGELIFRYVYQHAGARLPIQRLWISSLTDDAIRKGFAALRPGERFDALGDAARCRSEADWLVGMNATRAVTARGRQAGHDALYSIGRVQTPTLAMLVERERAIRAFTPRPYWEVRGDFRTSRGERFSALWRAVREDARRSEHERPEPKTIDASGGKPGRLATRALADDVASRDRSARSLVERVTAKTVREPPPLLFDLTSLQRTANRRFGFSAARTLELAQALYERHKILTYPRTDSRYLSNDVASELRELFEALAVVPDYAAFASELLANPPRASRRVFDDTKVHDHHAIIPTRNAIRIDAIDRDERRLFDLVARRFVGAFFPDAEFATTDVWIRVGDATSASANTTNVSASDPPNRSPSATSTKPTEVPILDQLPAMPDRYFARGRVRLVAGWQTVAGVDGARDPRERDADPNAEPVGVLPQLVEGETLDGAYAPLEKQTTPPPRYSEATLLGAMESAGKAIDDEALRAAMKDRGLGTPATRAATIETLLRRGYIDRTRSGGLSADGTGRTKQMLVPTEMGIALIAALPVASLASAELTGSWEARLARISRGEETRTTFMADIARYVRDTVDAIRGAAPPAPPPPGSAPQQRWSRDGKRRGGGGKRQYRRADQPQRRPRDASRPQPSRAPRDTSRPPREVLRSSGEPARHQAPRSMPRARAPNKALGTPIEPARLACPRCREGSLITGARGWGCSRWRDGCRFVVWFQTAGKRLTVAQLRDLVTRGKTRKSRFNPEGDGIARSGRLVLDASSNDGATRFEPG